MLFLKIRTVFASSQHITISCYNLYIFVSVKCSKAGVVLQINYSTFDPSVHLVVLKLSLWEIYSSLETDSKLLDIWKTFQTAAAKSRNKSIELRHRKHYKKKLNYRNTVFHQKIWSFHTHNSNLFFNMFAWYFFRFRLMYVPFFQRVCICLQSDMKFERSAIDAWETAALSLRMVHFIQLYG